MFSSKSSFTGYKRGPALPVRGKGQTRANILLCQVREIAQKLLVAHSGRQVIQDVVNGDPQAPYARLAAALSGFDGNDLGIIHGEQLMTPEYSRQCALD